VDGHPPSKSHPPRDLHPSQRRRNVKVKVRLRRRTPPACRQLLDQESLSWEHLIARSGPATEAPQVSRRSNSNSAHQPGKPGNTPPHRSDCRLRFPFSLTTQAPPFTTLTVLGLSHSFPGGHCNGQIGHGLMQLSAISSAHTHWQRPTDVSLPHLTSTKPRAIADKRYLGPISQLAHTEIR